MKDTFKKVICESVYPLLHSSTMPAYRSGDTTVEEVSTMYFKDKCFRPVAVRFPLFSEKQTCKGKKMVTEF